MTRASLPCLNLPVYTTTGRYLGRVVEVEVDVTAKVVLAYQVAASLPWLRLWRKRLLISPQQVVSLTPQAMVVDEARGSQAAAEPVVNLVAEPS